MLTIGALARRFGLSRSALLYYDRIGLLRPSSQSAAGYRLYAPADCERLRRIVELREAGVPLARIGEVVDDQSTLASALTARLAAIDAEAGALQAQREVLQAMLGCSVPAAGTALTREGWTAMFRAIGLDDAAMQRWHAEFERRTPEAHEAFLLSLGLEAPVIAEIRRRSRAPRSA